MTTSKWHERRSWSGRKGRPVRPYSLSEIAQIVGGTVIRGNPGSSFTKVEIDSRKVQPGDLFWCIRGERADGHSFVADVALRGAGAAVIEHPVLLPEGDVVSSDFGLVTVDSTVRAIGALAKAYRKELPVSVIGVTGSVGKTSTKDLAGSVLGTRYSTYRNPGNLNSHIGLPLAVFGMDRSHRFAFLEMAMRKKGEIADLCDIARPGIGILTDISASHLGELGSIENIAEAKSEILECLPADGLAVLCGDNSWVRRVSDRAKCRTVFYGLGGDSDCRAHDVRTLGADGSEFAVTYRGAQYRFSIRAPGLHQVQNALPAVVIGLELGLSYEDIKRGLAEASLSPMRLEVLKLGSLTVINDAYNASPKSMRAALDLLLQIGRNRRLAILGDMLEMGEGGPEAHREAGRYAATKATHLVAIGPLGREIKTGWDEVSCNPSAHFQDKESAWDYLSRMVSEGDTCLVKASRGMGFETIVERLKSLQEKTGADA